MADIRINSLPSTATSFNTDDYIAIDGASGGTRKMLAATLPLTDVTLGGSSGPSVKSTLSARAPRQGLVLDGTAGATFSGVPAFGTNPFSYVVFIRPNQMPSVASAIIRGAANSADLGYLTNGTIQLNKADVSNTLSTPSGQISAGKTACIVYTRGSGTGTFYVNGVSVASGSDSVDYSAATTVIGGTAPTYIHNGFIYALIYNRALSASEVVALYEAGAPAGADYNSASSTTLLSGTFVNGIGGGTYAYSTFSGASATGFTATSTSTSYKTAVSPTAFSVVKGRKYRLTYTLTLNSGTAPKASIGDPSNSSYMDAEPTLVAGTNTIEFTCTTTASNAKLNFWVGAVSDFAISGVALIPLGLLLAPDAAQAGGGLTWYDTSGNAANITLPASGVSWNVPFGNNIAASGTNQNITLTPSGTGSVLAHDTNAFYRNTNSGSDTATKLKVKTASNAFLAIDGGAATSGVSFGIYNSSSNPVRQSAIVGIASNTTAGSEAGYLSFFTQTGGSSLTERGRFTETGNYLIGTTTDSGNGKLQLATHATSAGGIGFGTGLSLFTSSTAGQLVLKDGSGTSPFLAFYDTSNNNRMAVGAIGTTSYVNSVAGPLQLWSSNTTALTLDSSQNATFAGTITGTIATFTRTGADGTVNISRASGASASLGAGTSNFYLGTNNAYSTVLFTNGTTALTLDSSQNATFAGDITISSAYPKINLTDTNNNSDFSVLNDNGRLAIYDETNAAYRFTVGATGGIKIGSTPEDVGANNLKVQGNLTVSGTGNSTFAGNVISKNTAILFGDGADNSASLYATGGPVKFWANATEAARIFANGNLFIGASPVDGGQKLQVSGTAAISNLLTAAGASISGSNAPSAGASVEINYGQISNSGRIFAYDRTGSAFKDIYLDGSSITLRSGASATTALTLDSSQRVIAQGQIWSSNLGNTLLTGFANATTIANNIISLYEATGSTNIQRAGRITNYDGGSGWYGLKLQTPSVSYPDFSGTVTWKDCISIDARQVKFSDSISTQAGSALTPASATAGGTAGTIQWDANYIYVCTATNTWKRVAIATWP